MEDCDTLFSKLEAWQSYLQRKWNIIFHCQSESFQAIFPRNLSRRNNRMFPGRFWWKHFISCRSPLNMNEISFNIFLETSFKMSRLPQNLSLVIAGKATFPCDRNVLSISFTFGKNIRVSSRWERQELSKGFTLTTISTFPFIACLNLEILKSGEWSFVMRPREVNNLKVWAEIRFLKLSAVAAS